MKHYGMATPTLVVSNLEKSFGTVDAVRDVSFTVDANEIYGVLGPNGAGKTTTINVITGQLHPDGGHVDVFGTDPTDHPLQVRDRIGVLPERESPPSFLTPREYFDLVSDVRGIDNETRDDRVDTWATRLGFHDQLNTLTTDLSRGQQQKVMITQAFLHEPAFVIIDEPLVNLDPIMQERVKTYLEAYRDDGNAVLLSTHDVHVAEALCDRVGIIQDGELVAELDDDSITRDAILAYFTDRQ